MSAHGLIPKASTLVGVWASLIVLTGLTSAASYVDVGEWNIVVALAIAVTKASLVVWIFMGVRNVTTLTRLFVVAGLVWLAIMVLITYSDYGTRTWTYQPKAWADNPARGLSR